MRIPTRMYKASALLCSGLVLGAAGGYAADALAASPSKTPAHAAKHAMKKSRERRLRRAVSLTAVVPDGHGQFGTLSIERGKFVSVSGDTLTLEEGTRRASYRTVQVTLPSDARVRLSREPSSLSALTPQDHVTIVQAPRRTTVLARPLGARKSSSASPATSAGAAG